MAPFIVVLEWARRLTQRRGSGKLRCQGHSERFRELIEAILFRNLLQSSISIVRPVKRFRFISDDGGDPEFCGACLRTLCWVNSRAILNLRFYRYEAIRVVCYFHPN